MVREVDEEQVEVLCLEIGQGLEPAAVRFVVAAARALGLQDNSGRPNQSAFRTSTF